MKKKKEKTSMEKAFHLMNMSNHRVHRRIADKSNGTCFYCGVEFGEGWKAMTIDHLEPLSKGGPDEDWNKVLACKRCNRWKGGKSFKNFMELLPKWLEASKNLGKYQN
jgi:5-methylcytosine-specific restriction endonuclease McrA